MLLLGLIFLTNVEGNIVCIEFGSNIVITGPAGAAGAAIAAFFFA